MSSFCLSVWGKKTSRNEKTILLFLTFSDPLNPAAGELLRDEFLCHGNGRDMLDMYKNILNEDFDSDALIESIIDDFHENQQ